MRVAVGNRPSAGARVSSTFPAKSPVQSLSSSGKRHLTVDVAVATAVGQRYGKVVLLEVDAARKRAEGREFFRSDNGVWLTDAVPAIYLKVLP